MARGVDETGLVMDFWLGGVMLTHRAHYTDHLLFELCSEFSMIKRFQKIIRKGKKIPN